MDTQRSDQLAQQVVSICRTNRGHVAALKDGTAIAVMGKDVKCVGSLADYRAVFNDSDTWFEVTTAEGKRQFCNEAAGLVTETNPH